MSEIQTPAKRKINVLATRHSLFVARLIKNELDHYGISCQIFQEVHDFEDCQYIVISPQVFTKLPPRMWCYQMEQSTSNRWFTEDYLKMLSEAEVVLDYSIRNIEFLEGKGIPYNRVFYCPVAILPGMTSLSQRPEKLYDVLFYGDLSCERRKRFMDRISARFKVKIPHDTFGDDLYPFIRQSKVIVNIHFYEKSLLETTRIHECLSLGAVVVSEKSHDQDQHGGLDNIVHFTEIDDVEEMVLKIQTLVENEENLEQSRRAVEDYGQRKPNPFTYFFGRLLLAKKWIQYSAYHSRVGEVPQIRQNGTCLSLPETPQRHLSFLQNNKRNFAVFHGLRSAQGWVGCALSYKFMVQYALEQGWDYFVVCEDDVELYPDFDEKWAKVFNYLQEKKGDWDVFCGIIADLHSDTRILKIDTRDDIDFVYINKMTSMVFNVYNRSVFKTLASWDDQNENVLVNTIDRYLESQSKLRVITTHPYLVGHLEEQHSTLWGIKNTSYNYLISRSINLMEKKIAEFQKRPPAGELTLTEKLAALTDRVTQDFRERTIFFSGIRTYLERLKHNPEKYQSALKQIETILRAEPLHGKVNAGPVVRKPGEKRKLLIITSLFPSTRHGGGLRLYDFVLELANHFEVHIFSKFIPWLDGQSYDELKAQGFQLYLVPDDKFLPEALDDHLTVNGLPCEKAFDVVLLENESDLFFEKASRLGEVTGYTLMECVGRRFYIDFVTTERQGGVDLDPILERFLKYASKEAEAFQMCDACFCVTRQDHDFARSLYSGRAKSDVIETGISRSQFDLSKTSEFYNQHAVLFVGNFLHTPNVEGIVWYLKHVHPMMKKEFPEYQIRVVGNGPIKNLLEEFASDPQIEVVGWVDRLETEILKARVCIAPIFSGAGIRGKVIQYAAMGCPTVTTQLGAEGLESQVSTGGVIVAADENDFGDKLRVVFRDIDQLRPVGQKLKKVTLELFDVPSLIQKMLVTLEKARQEKTGT